MRLLALALVAGCGFHHGDASRDGAAASDAADAAIDVTRDWWNTAWGVRFPLTIANTSPDSLAAGYQIGVVFDVGAAPCTANRDDMRVVYGATELTRVIDSVGPPEWTWFPLAAPLASGATSSGEYWLYCGNPSPPPAPKDPAKVFDFYDSFAMLDTTTWTTMNTVSLSSGHLVAGGGGVRDNGIVTKGEPFSAKHAVDYSAVASSATNSDWWAGFQIGTMDVAPWLHWYTHNANAACPDFLGVAGDTAWYGTDHPLDTQPHIYGIENYGDQSMYRLEDAVYQTHIYAPMQPPPAQVDVRLWDGSDTTTVSFDWVRVRQAVNPPPAATVGAAETY